MDITGLSQFLREFGYPVAVSVACFWYIYTKQKHLDAASAEREKKAYEREIEHRGFIDSLKTDLCTVARANNAIVTEINQDVDTLHQKMVNLGGDVDRIKADVGSIRADVTEIRRDVQHIDNTMVIKNAKNDEE